MSVIKCKMCGGDLVLVEGQSVAECEYCGSKQTVPSSDNEKKLNLFASANKLRLNCEFDRAAGIYDAIKAEFPSEAESYWGLVLCKYGIEYVDDPATGKKVPTCHRLSYDSVLDDANLDLAMENADAVARKVYREEAKHLEKIRTGILEVSSNEKPYDIFLCYKETDENGDRTLDSVLAQDLYTALTAQGYRVFFSRITLQGKLGEAYEPYIFAALNSARVMLAIGTDPEYYSAVWVKNEWSRYLKICAEDKSRHLIPCYKDMDAYDMPKEFRPLQGVDLGKMGAVQDILFNMEKYIPLKKQTTTIIQEKVVVGGTGGSNKIASLLDRGNMALEDGDWAKADSFFEDVLNNDSKNAQAYIGKALAQEKCRTMDALVRKRRDVYQRVSSKVLEIPERSTHISGMVEKFALPGFLEAGYLRTLYDVDRTYESEVSGRKQQYQDERKWWENHKLLSRAEKFASGSVAEALHREKQHLFAQLNDRIKQAEQADAKTVAEMEQEYDAFLADTDAQTEKLYQDAIVRREKDYQTWLEQAKSESEPDALRKLSESFAGLGDYKDSRNLAEHCRKQADEEKEKRENENARRNAEKKARTRRMAILATGITVVVFAVLMLVTKIIIPSSKYRKAEALLAVGDPRGAVIAFSAAGNWKDAQERSLELWGQVTQRDSISAGDNHTVALHSNGNVVAVGSNYAGECNVKDLRGIVAVSAGAVHTVGLREDGTVATTEYTGSYYFGQCDVEDWTEIVAVSAKYYNTVGLRRDGTVVAVGWNKHGQCDVEEWNNIVEISSGGSHTVGLRCDGTVVATGSNEDGSCNVSDWTDIVSIGAGGHTVGLRSDGTVVAVGDNENGKCNVSDWTDIVAISAGSEHTVGLRKDGTVVAIGENDDGQCEVGGWTDIVAISAGDYYTVGLRSDGTVVAVGDNDYYQCKVGNWTNIKLPVISEEQQAAMAAAKQEREAKIAAEKKAEEERIAAEKKAEEERLAAEKKAKEAQQIAAYSEAEELLKSGNTVKAAMAFGAAGDYLDAKERSFSLWEKIAVRESVGTGFDHVVALNLDGTAKATGENECGQRNVSAWTDLIAVDADYDYSLGLKSDGTVVDTGSWERATDVESWTDIVAICAEGNYALGLKSDGTVVTTYEDAEIRSFVDGLHDVIAISGTCALKSDGTVVVMSKEEYTQADVADWTDITAISAGSKWLVALKKDGTVVSAGVPEHWQKKLAELKKIVAVSTDYEHIVALRANGTVVAIGSSQFDKCKVEEWKDMAGVYTGVTYTVGLGKNGQLSYRGSMYCNAMGAYSFKNVKVIS